MVDAYISTTTLSNTVTAALDQYIRSALRHQPMLRGLADVRPKMPSHPGSSITLWKHADLAPATTPLSELTDPDYVAIPNPTSVTLTPAEYGSATLSSVKVGVTSFADVDSYQRNQVLWNMRDTLDALVSTAISGGTNVKYATGGASTPTATNTVANEDVIATADIRHIVTKLRTAAAQGRQGDLYWCGIHPDVSHDLRAEVGSGAFVDLHQYAAPGVFWPGNIGVYQGAFFVESARMKTAADGVDIDGAGSGTTLTTVYRTIFMGREALAEGVLVEPESRIGVVVDRLNRFQPLGWYGYLGWARFREEALWRLESGSSMNA